MRYEPLGSSGELGVPPHTAVRLSAHSRDRPRPTERAQDKILRGHPYLSISRLLRPTVGLRLDSILIVLGRRGTEGRERNEDNACKVLQL